MLVSSGSAANEYHASRLQGVIMQGGEGCRDKRTMDRRDAAKYRNSKHKSVSKKSARVGKEGAARRQRGQKADK